MRERRKVSVVGASVVAPTKPTLTAPSAGAVITGAGVTVSATVTAGQVPDRIDFVLDPGVSEIVVATDAASPYSQTWTVAEALGDHTLVARFVYGSGYVDSDPTAIAIGPASTILWARSDLSVTHTTTVSAWNDLGGSGHHLLQATGGKQPAYSATGGPQNGPMITGVIANSTRLVASWAQSQPVHLFIVDKQGAGLADNACLCDGGGGAVNSMRVFYTAAGTQWNLQAGATLAGPVATAGWHIRECIFNGVTSEHFLDGVSAGIGNAGTAATGGLCLFSAGDDRFYSDNSVVEIIAFSSVQSAPAKAALMTYLQTKYGL